MTCLDTISPRNQLRLHRVGLQYQRVLPATLEAAGDLLGILGDAVLGAYSMGGAAFTRHSDLGAACRGRAAAPTGTDRRLQDRRGIWRTQSGRQAASPGSTRTGLSLAGCLITGWSARCVTQLGSPKLQGRDQSVLRQEFHCLGRGGAGTGRRKGGMAAHWEGCTSQALLWDAQDHHAQAAPTYLNRHFAGGAGTARWELYGGNNTFSGYYCGQIQRASHGSREEPPIGGRLRPAPGRKNHNIEQWLLSQ